MTPSQYASLVEDCFFDTKLLQDRVDRSNPRAATTRQQKWRKFVDQQRDRQFKSNVVPELRREQELAQSEQGWVEEEGMGNGNGNGKDMSTNGDGDGDRKDGNGGDEVLTQNPTYLIGNGGNTNGDGVEALQAQRRRRGWNEEVLPDPANAVDDVGERRTKGSPPKGSSGNDGTGTGTETGNGTGNGNGNNLQMRIGDVMTSWQSQARNYVQSAANGMSGMRPGAMLAGMQTGLKNVKVPSMGMSMGRPVGGPMIPV